MSHTMEIPVSINGIGDMDLSIPFMNHKDFHSEIIVTCGEDGLVYFTELESGKILDHLSSEIVLDGPITSVAVSNDSTELLIASEDNNTVYRYSMPPQSKLIDIVYRATTRIRQIVCSKQLILVVSENPTYHIVLQSDTEKSIAVEGHCHYVKSAAIDPKEEYICSSSEDGTVRIFKVDLETFSTTEVASFNTHFQNIKDEEALCRCAWLPLVGDFVAAPSNIGSIVLYSRTSWDRRFQLWLPLGKTNLSDINIVAFSPNGRYLAAATLSKQVVVWDISDTASEDLTVIKECIGQVYTLEYPILSMRWSRVKNTLVLYHLGGKIFIIDSIIPQDSPSPLEFSNKYPSSLTTKSSPPDDQDDDNEEDTHEARLQAIKASFGFGATGNVRESGSITRVNESTVTSYYNPFQSGAVCDGTLQLLAWNLIGDIEVIEGKVSESIDERFIKISFADKSRRSHKFADNYGFTLGSLDTHGAFFATCNQTELFDDDEQNETANICFYYPFNAWANCCEWYFQLSNAESIVCLASSSKFCAIATSYNCLRIFTLGGVEYAVIQFAHRVITMTALENQLAVVRETSPNQLEVEIFYISVSNCRRRIQSQAIRAFSSVKLEHWKEKSDDKLRIRWIGFDENLVLYVIDSNASIHALTSSVGWHWIPLGHIDSDSEKFGSKRSNIFTLGVMQDKVYYIRMERGAKCPRLRTKLRPIPDTFPLSSATFLVKERKEQSDVKCQATNIFWQNARINHQMLLQEDVQVEDSGTSKRKDNDHVHEKAEMDKALIIMIKTACANDELARAFDLACCIHLEKSLTIAQKIAAHYGSQQLQTKLCQLYRERYERMDERLSTPAFPAQKRIHEEICKESFEGKGRKPSSTLHITKETSISDPIGNEIESKPLHTQPSIIAKPLTTPMDVAPPLNPFAKKSSDTQVTTAETLENRQDKAKRSGLECLAFLQSPSKINRKKFKTSEKF